MSTFEGIAFGQNNNNQNCPIIVYHSKDHNVQITNTQGAAHYNA